ncbi:MAG: spondin domain-containing protein, partial [Acidobacteriota bacterium]
MTILRALALALLLIATPAMAVEVTVTVENLSPENGTFLTPTWVGAHDGSFDIYDLGAPASQELERIAEDGTIDPLSMAFLASGNFVDGIVLGENGPIAPGETTSLTLDLDTTARYLSYAAMVLPSNDAFIANGNPVAIPLFDEFGTFIGGSFVVFGSDVRDAGTEFNDELPANTAFFGQAAPDTGVVEGGVITVHPGFNAPGTGGILDDAQFAAGDFTEQGYRIARITVSAAVDVTVSIENLSPENGTFFTPVWVGFQDGSFDLFDSGAAASEGLERLAEDGNNGPLSDAFLASGNGMIDATVFGPTGPVAPGETATGTFTVDGSKAYNRFLSLASMVLPSNDAFFGNGNPLAIPVFDAQGNFIDGSYLISGNQVYDAGTEVNDEIAGNTAFLAQPG